MPGGGFLIGYALTCRADAFYHEADTGGYETWWQRYLRGRNVMQTIGTLAFLTIKMPMLVIVLVMVLAGA